MCARYVHETPSVRIAELFGAVEAFEPPPPAFNAAPTQLVPAVRARAEAGGRELVLLRWGLIPSWAKDPSIGSKLFNARSETAAEKPSFRAAFQARRCLVPMDAFYEWQRGPAPRQPFLFRMRSREPFGVAGLWERWESPERAAVDSCTILTTTPNELVAQVHDRMPVILERAAYETWLRTGPVDVPALQALLVPYPAGEMEAFPVSRRVGNVRADDAGLAQPLNG